MPSIVGKDIEVLVAPADLVGQYPDVGHQRQVGDEPVDPPAATGRRRRFFSDRLHALGIASDECDFGSSPGEFDRSGSPDAASGPGEHDDGHPADLTVARRRHAREATRPSIRGPVSERG